ncbi:hypothetical protein [Vallitalea sp.]|uniref:hypothetical protein n=1 Tax=Vallitalea sp. TaxID=1882829 RepID=UPI0025D31CAE|nr:hypothetical protein [Vallitalea sp.]MCT4687962.1 hypothetical protein [Vallitalea sp.]
MTINPIYATMTSRPYGINKNKTSNAQWSAGINFSSNEQEQNNRAYLSDISIQDHYNYLSYKAQSSTKIGSNKTYNIDDPKNKANVQDVLINSNNEEPQKSSFENFIKDIGIPINKISKNDLEKMRSLYKEANNETENIDKINKSWNDLYKLVDKYVPKPNFDTFAKELGIDVKKIPKADLNKMKALFKSSNDSVVNSDKAEKALDDLFKIAKKYIPKPEFQDFAKDINLDINKVKKDDLDKMKTLFNSANNSQSADEIEKKWNELMKLIDKYIPNNNK